MKIFLYPPATRLLWALLICIACAQGASQTTHPAPKKKQTVPGKTSKSGTAKPKSAATAKKPATAGHKPSGPLTAYRTGHGNHGVGTIKAPSRYTEPAPAGIATAPLPIEPRVQGAAAIEFPAALGNFFAHLKATEDGNGTLTTRILQFGDSHTAADMFTGRMRTLFQTKFGDGGAGFTYAGHPFAGYRILGTSRGQSSGWVSEGVHFTQIEDTRLGLGGVANTAHRAGESVSLDAPCAKFELHYMDQPGGGDFTLEEDGQTLTEVSTDSSMKAADEPAQTLNEECAPGMIHHFEVVTDSSRPVRLLGFVTEQPGITYEALGLNGAEAGLMLRWNAPMFTNYMVQRDPALIVLAYGTNEAGNHNWTYEAYSTMLGRLVDLLHTTTPDASIIVIGPPDRSLRIGGKRRGGSWKPFTETLHITEAQRDTCRTHNCAFWSWRDRMGGLGSMNQWAAQGIAQGDHTHFTSTGYVKLADFFYSDMIDAYSAWKTAANR